MSLGPEDVKKIAHLAHLHVSNEEVASLTKDLDNILQLVEKMDQVDTKAVKPLAHPFDETQPLRKDQVTEVNQRDVFQAIAPQTKAGLYIVPQFVETE